MPIFEQEGVHVAKLGGLPRAEYPSVRVDERGLVLAGKLAVARADLASVVVQLEERTAVVMRTKADLEIRGGASARTKKGQARGYACTFTNRADADALLRALGRDPARTASEVAFEPSLLRAGFDDLPLWRALLQTGIAMALLAVLLPFLARPGRGLTGIGGVLDSRLELGSDGLRVRGRLSNAFVPYREIRSVTTRDNAVVLIFADGRTSYLRLAVSARIPDVVEKIERSIAASAAPQGDEIVERLHEIAGSKPEQLAGLRELGTDADGSYRSSSLPRERLWALVEDDAAAPATRARAAAALSGSLANEDRERLRIAADATVSPRLRIALDAVQNDDDAALAEHLDEAPELKHAREAIEARS